MDNNVLASPKLPRIVDDLLELGYGKGEVTDTANPKQRVVDFNQGVDASFLKPKTVRLISQLNIKPMRVAFDRVGEKRTYLAALKRAHEAGVNEFSNYMLYNFNDTPRDLYERLSVNIQLNEEWLRETPGKISGKIYSYPMRYAPIFPDNGSNIHHARDTFSNSNTRTRDWLQNPAWTPRFARNLEIIRARLFFLNA